MKIFSVSNCFRNSALGTVSMRASINNIS
jgi:hypothetical protein